MSKAVYDVIGGATREVKKQYAVLDGVARKIKKSYQVVDGVARLFYSADAFVYTGNFTTSQVTISGVLHNLYTLTGSGTLTLTADAKYWMCGGGGKGGASTYSNLTDVQDINMMSGGGGAGGKIKSGTLAAGTHVITVGATAGASKIGSTTAAAGGSASRENGGSGTSGGAAGAGQYHEDYGWLVGTGKAGTGTGESTYPFGLSSLRAHCAGGGSGASRSRTSNVYGGAAGGSSGGNGGTPVKASDTNTINGGSGGTYGGGKGGNVTRSVNSSGTSINTAYTGSAATFYGGGGGGGACPYGVETNPTYPLVSKSGGNGYQGVVYIAIPA